MEAKLPQKNLPVKVKRFAYGKALNIFDLKPVLEIKCCGQPHDIRLTFIDAFHVR